MVSVHRLYRVAVLYKSKLDMLLDMLHGRSHLTILCASVERAGTQELPEDVIILRDVSCSRTREVVEEAETIFRRC